MAFTFGAAPSPGGSAPPTGGGVSFGSSAPTPATVTGGFSSGGAPAPAAGGFSFGGSTPATLLGPSAPSTSFSFGGIAPATPAASTPAAPAFGGKTAFGGASTTSAPAAPSFAFGSTAANTPAPGTLVSNSTATNNLPTVPLFRLHFPGRRVADALRPYLSSAWTTLQAQEVEYLLSSSNENLGTLLLNPSLPDHVAPNASLRQQLQQQGVVQLEIETDSRISTTPARLTLAQWAPVFTLADELGISEIDALSLWAAARSSGESTTRVAHELYWSQRTAYFGTLRRLILHRQAHSNSLAATDILLQQGWIVKLIGYVKDSTYRLDDVWQRLRQQEQQQRLSQMAIGDTNSEVAKDAYQERLERRWQQLVLERQSVIECLFFLAYHTQWTADEVGLLLDVLQELSERLPILDPWKDVPAVQQQKRSSSSWAAPPSPPLTAEQWSERLIEQTRQQGMLLRCVAALTTTVVTALDSKAELVDRTTHEVNLFGKVSSIMYCRAVCVVLSGVFLTCFLSLPGKCTLATWIHVPRAVGAIGPPSFQTHDG